jgi:predicted ATPase/class 3 adenylate cyclase
VALAGLPSGTVTLLFTDVEGSTRLLHSLGDARYAEALAEHRRLLRASFVRHGGVEVDTQGDAFFVAFGSAAGALAAASDARSSLEETPIRIRVGIHTGAPLCTDEGYVGADVHRAARIAAAGHGGQVLLSSATAASIERGVAELVDLGEHRLKDLASAERIYQLGDAEFPPLKSLSASNLPVPATPFQGRVEELEVVTAALADPVSRLVTLIGPGGIGKTRLALQAAAESSESFPDGLWWVGLAPLTDPALVLPGFAETLGVRETEELPLREALAERLAGRRLLVLLDNAEHLLPNVAAEVADLLNVALGLTVLATSRERLQLTAERVILVDPLSQEDAQSFFKIRAAAHGVAIEQSEELAQLCDRLDRLPLALQLAAARVRTFSVGQLLERLSGRLDLLRGERDLEPRQRTLRATMEWSHDLLLADETALFRRLSVFAGGCTLAAAEAVCGFGADALEAIADKSLVQMRNEAGPRFWMLESIREFAAERLEEAGETDELRRRHADWFHALALHADEWLRSGEPEEVATAWLEADIDNLRAAVAFALEIEATQIVRDVTLALRLYWIDRGSLAEARSLLERALALDDVEDLTKRRLYSVLGTVAYMQGDHIAAVEASDAAGELAMKLAGVGERFEELDALADAAMMREDWASAEALLEEALAEAESANNGVGMSACRLGLADLAMDANRLDRAESLLDENLPFVRSRGQTRCEGFTLLSLSRMTALKGASADASDHAVGGARRATQIKANRLLILCLERFAYVAPDLGAAQEAALVLGATESARDELDLAPDEAVVELRGCALAKARAELGDDALQAVLSEGRSLGLREALTAVAGVSAGGARDGGP